LIFLRSVSDAILANSSRSFFNLSESIIHTAFLAIFLLIFLSQFLSFGTNTTPPFLQRGDLVDPALARPVPFCLNGFLPPPSTIALVLACALPALALDLCTYTT